MKQAVDIEGLILEWSIDGYTPIDKRINRDEYWCNCGLSVKIRTAHFLISKRKAGY